MFNPALTTCASERMKTQRFSYFADFAARERIREAKHEKNSKRALLESKAPMYAVTMINEVSIISLRTAERDERL